MQWQPVPGGTRLNGIEFVALIILMVAGLSLLSMIHPQDTTALALLPIECVSK